MSDFILQRIADLSKGQMMVMTRDGFQNTDFIFRVCIVVYFCMKILYINIYIYIYIYISVGGRPEPRRSKAEGNSAIKVCEIICVFFSPRRFLVPTRLAAAHFLLYIKRTCI